MKNKKILFSIARGNGGASKVYRDIVSYLNNNYGYNIEIVYPMKNWFFSHFKKYDIVFSVIPFIFKPNTKKFYSILVGNYEKEASYFNLKGLISLLFRPKTFNFSDKIILMNSYLLKKMNVLQKNKKKIVIIPNHIEFLNYESIRNFNRIKLENKKFRNIDNINILTITGFGLYDKAKGVINLKKVLAELAKKYSNKKIIWNIAGNSDNEIFKKVKKDFDKIEKPNNLEINWLGWINEEELFNQYKKNDLFLYWTKLDVFPTILLEVGAAGLPMLVNNFESFYENIPENFICKSEDEMLEKIENLHFEENQKLNIENSKKYDIEKIIQQFIKLIEN